MHLTGTSPLPSPQNELGPSELLPRRRLFPTSIPPPPFPLPRFLRPLRCLLIRTVSLGPPFLSDTIELWLFVQHLSEVSPIVRPWYCVLAKNAQTNRFWTLDFNSYFCLKAVGIWLFRTVSNDNRWVSAQQCMNSLDTPRTRYCQGSMILSAEPESPYILISFFDFLSRIQQHLNTSACWFFLQE